MGNKGGNLIPEHFGQSCLAVASFELSEPFRESERAFRTVEHCVYSENAGTNAIKDREGKAFHQRFPIILEGNRLHLGMEPYQTDPAATGFSWGVTVSSAGSVKTIGIPVDGVSPPTLVLRLNRSRGEWSSYYTAGKVRRAVVGAALTLEAFRGIGWVETGAGAAPSTARWQLSLQ